MQAVNEPIAARATPSFRACLPQAGGASQSLSPFDVYTTAISSRARQDDNALSGHHPHLSVIIALVMSTQKFMLTEFPWDQRYQLSCIADVLTPALLLYPEILAANIDRTGELLDGDANRWRVHIKTAKLGYTVRTLVG